MLVLRDRLVNIPLMSLQTGTRVGTTAAAIIDPRRLNIVAFYCEGPGIDFNPAVIHTGDIREYSNIGMIIDSSDNIMAPTDLVRLQEVLNFHFELEGKQVVDDHGDKLGKVINFTADTDSFYVVKLHIKPTLFKSFSSAELIIDRSQIVSVTDKKIIVKQADIKVEESAPAAEPIRNPFRKTKPQTQSMQRAKE